MIKPTSYSDHQLIRSVNISLTIIMVLGTIATALYFNTPKSHPSRVLGSQTATPSATISITK